jgi:pyridoxal phosphate enzyme (YggS family)
MNASAATAIEMAVAEVRRRVAAACERAGRDPSSVTIVAVSKTFEAADVAEAMRAGVMDFGENRVQEALPKIGELVASEQPRWHFIGQLQRNKAKAVTGAFAAIHSIDSIALLEAVERHATRPIDVFIQVNVTGAPGQGGAAPGDVAALVAHARGCRHAQLAGLMTIGHNSPDPEDSRAVFARLAAMARDLSLPALSMGMTNDYEVAIEEGATHIRVGRAIFGGREG